MTDKAHAMQVASFNYHEQDFIQMILDHYIVLFDSTK